MAPLQVPAERNGDEALDKDAPHMNDANIVSTNTFTLFPQLPTELRLQIWKFALPGPRYVLTSEYLLRDNFIRQFRVSEVCVMPWICAESRQLYCGEYKLFPGLGGKHHSFPDKDTLSNTPSLAGENIYLSLETDIFCFSPTFVVKYGVPGYVTPNFSPRTVYIDLDMIRAFVIFASAKTSETLLTSFAREGVKTILVGRKWTTPNYVGEFTNFLESNTECTIDWEIIFEW